MGAFVAYLHVARAHRALRSAEGSRWEEQEGSLGLVMGMEASFRFSRSDGSDGREEGAGVLLGEGMRLL